MISLAKEPADVDNDRPGERGRWRQDPSEELPPTPPIGAEHHDFGITSAGGEEEGLGHGDKGREGAGAPGGESGFVRCQRTAYIVAARPRRRGC